jgi:hypothetical protein
MLQLGKKYFGCFSGKEIVSASIQDFTAFFETVCVASGELSPILVTKLTAG